MSLPGFFLAKLGGRSNYTKLIKLMYLADRELFQHHGRTITGDRMYALPLGPVLSHSLDRLKGVDRGWASFVRLENYEVELIRSVEFHALSRADLDALRAVYDKYGQMTWPELVDHCHRLPEWAGKRIGGHRTRVAITLTDLVAALQLGAEEAASVEQSVADRREVGELWGALGIAPAHA